MNQAILRRELEQLQVRGVLTPDAVVAAARDPLSPMHEEFEWDDAAAGEAHRINQARTLIRSVRLVVHEHRLSFATVQYVRDATAPAAHQGYISLPSIAEDEDRAVLTIEAELARLNALVTRVREIALTLGQEDRVRDYFAQLAGVSEIRAVA